MATEHTLVGHEHRGENVIARIVEPEADGDDAVCEQCGAVVAGTLIEHLVFCPRTRRFGQLRRGDAA
jgi:hypothetical protein